MKKVISILLITFTLLPMFAEDPIYEFTEQELREYVSEIISDAYDKKDQEIAELKKEHELEILDKDFIIDNQELTIDGDAVKILGLEIKTDAQSAFIKWTPVIIIGSIGAGIVGGILIGRNL